MPSLPQIGVIERWRPSYDVYLYWCVNSLGPGDAIWRQRSGSTLAQAMACCLTAPSHYLNQCWLIISGVINFMQSMCYAVFWIRYLSLICNGKHCNSIHDSKVHGTNMGSIWDRQDPGWPHVGSRNFTIWDIQAGRYVCITLEQLCLDVLVSAVHKGLGKSQSSYLVK